jgi:hypothetical protein
MAEREKSRRELAREQLARGEWTSAAELFRAEDARIDGDWAELMELGSSHAAQHGADPGNLVGNR